MLNTCIFQACVTLLTSLVIYSVYNMRGDVSRLPARAEELEKELDELKSALGKLVEETRRTERQLDDGKREVGLLRKDKTGMVDYAYGGKVVSTGDTDTLSGAGVEVLGLGICGRGRPERRILQSSAAPGDCWPFRGRGSALVELVRPIEVSHVTVEHAPDELLPGGAGRAAPRALALWGLSGPADGDPHFFGEFNFSRPGPDVQTFPVARPAGRRVRLVELRVLSNHGHGDYTCVYRVRVHGAA